MHMVDTTHMHEIKNGFRRQSKCITIARKLCLIYRMFNWILGQCLSNLIAIKPILNWASERPWVKVQVSNTDLTKCSKMNLIL